MNYMKFFLFTSICCLIGVSTSYADQRSDAKALFIKLSHENVINRLPDELRSLDATLATAEMYFQLKDHRNAERYYTLAIQKGNLMLQRLQTPVSTVFVQKPVSSPSLPHVLPAVTSPSPLTDIEQQSEYLSTRLVGVNGTYTVVKGDTIRLVAAKLGVSRAQLIAKNGLNQKDSLKPGQIIHYNNRRIIPEHPIKNGIVINIPDRMLYLFQQGTLSFSTAVALGTPTKTDQFIWQTPTGKFRVVQKAKDPTWTVPPSIQEEMRLDGKEVITSIPPGKNNPLGKYAIKTSLPGILIHSTTKPWSIYTYASHGCIRVYPERMEELFKLIHVNAPGEIIYHPVKIAVTEDGKILLEAHTDIYNKTKGLAAEAKALIRARKLDNKVDWEKVKRVISRKAGVAEEITRSSNDLQESVEVSRSHSPS